MNPESWCRELGSMWSKLSQEERASYKLRKGEESRTQEKQRKESKAWLTPIFLVLSIVNICMWNKPRVSVLYLDILWMWYIASFGNRNRNIFGFHQKVRIWHTKILELIYKSFGNWEGKVHKLVDNILCFKDSISMNHEVQRIRNIQIRWASF